MSPEVQEILIFGLVGFLAQLIDGALGMGYGVVCSTVPAPVGFTLTRV